MPTFTFNETFTFFGQKLGFQINAAVIHFLRDFQILSHGKDIKILSIHTYINVHETS